MPIDPHSIAEADKPLYNWLVGMLTEHRKTAGFGFEPGTVAKELVSDGRIQASTEYLESAMHQVFADKRGISAAQQSANGTFSLGAARNARMQRTISANDVAQAIAQVRKENPTRQGIHGESALYAGLNLFTAASFFLGATKNFKDSVAVDEQGKRHIQWSSLTMAIGFAAISAACGYLGVSQLKSAVYTR